MAENAALETALGHARDRRRMPGPAERRVIRKAAGLTQVDVAAALGVSRVSVVRWESGARTPRGELANRYLSLLARLAWEAIR